jgi:NADH-quinone oxidoreductase subunit L
MFRLVFLTFHGEARYATAGAAAAPHGAPAPSADAAHRAHGAHAHDAQAAHAGHGHHLHDAPPAMAIALIVLAIGAALIGYIGVPASLGGSDGLAHFLAPSFTVEQTVEGASAATLPVHEAEGAQATEGLEMGLMTVSVVAALAGIGIAFFFFLKRREAADAVAARFAGLHRLLEHKYYVDDIYDAAVVQPILITSRDGLWRVVDAGVIDGAVNGVGEALVDTSSILRRLQTGSVRAYACSLVFGVVLILGFYLWY